MKAIRQCDQLIDKSKVAVEICRPTIKVLEKQSGESNLRKINPSDQFRSSISFFEQVMDVIPALQPSDAVQLICDLEVESNRTVIDGERMVHKAAQVQN